MSSSPSRPCPRPARGQRSTAGGGRRVWRLATTPDQDPAAKRRGQKVRRHGRGRGEAAGAAAAAVACAACAMGGWCTRAVAAEPAPCAPEEGGAGGQEGAGAVQRGRGRRSARHTGGGLRRRVYRSRRTRKEELLNLHLICIKSFDGNNNPAGTVCVATQRLDFARRLVELAED